jgi:hypothetical protein
MKRGWRYQSNSLTSFLCRNNGGCKSMLHHGDYLVGSEKNHRGPQKDFCPTHVVEERSPAGRLSQTMRRKCWLLQSALTF